MFKTTSIAWRDRIAARPVFDHLLPIGALAFWFFALAGVVPSDANARAYIYAGTATVSGLAMAASTFACSMTYQSSNVLMAHAREMFSKPLKRNWISVIRSNLLTSIAPLAALAVDGNSRSWGMAIAIYSVALLIARFNRALFWLQYTLFMQDVTVQIPKKIDVPMRSDL